MDNDKTLAMSFMRRVLPPLGSLTSRVLNRDPSDMDALDQAERVGRYFPRPAHAVWSRFHRLWMVAASLAEDKAVPDLFRVEFLRDHDLVAAELEKLAAELRN